MRSAAAVATPLIAIAVLIVSIWASQRVRRKQEFEILLEENRREATKRDLATRALTERLDREARERQNGIDQEAVKREQAIRASIDRSDRNFERLLARIDELPRQSAGVAERVVRYETRLESL